MINLDLDLAWKIFYWPAWLVGIVLCTIMVVLSVVVLKACIDIVKLCRVHPEDRWRYGHENLEVPVFELLMTAIATALVLVFGYTTVALAFPSLDIFPGVKMVAVIFCLVLVDCLTIPTIRKEKAELDKVSWKISTAEFYARDSRLVTKVSWVLTPNLLTGLVIFGIMDPREAIIDLVCAIVAIAIFFLLDHMILEMWGIWRKWRIK